MLETIKNISISLGYSYDYYSGRLETFRNDTLKNVLDYMNNGHPLDAQLVYLKSKIPYEYWETYNYHTNLAINTIVWQTDHKYTNLLLSKLNLLFQTDVDTEIVIPLLEDKECNIEDFKLYLFCMTTHKMSMTHSLYTKCRHMSILSTYLTVLIGNSQLINYIGRLYLNTTHSHAEYIKNCHRYIEVCVKRDLPIDSTLFKYLLESDICNLLLTMYSNDSVKLYSSMGICGEDMFNILIQLQDDIPQLNIGELLWYDLIQLKDSFNSEKLG